MIYYLSAVIYIAFPFFNANLHAKIKEGYYQTRRSDKKI